MAYGNITSEGIIAKGEIDMNGEYNRQKGFTRSGCFTIALAFGIVFSALGIYIFVLCGVSAGKYTFVSW